MILQPSLAQRARPARRISSTGGSTRDRRSCVEDDRFRPYCFVLREAESLRTTARPARRAVRAARSARARRCCASRRAIARRRRAAARAARRDLALEADIRFPYRYLIDLGIKGGVAIEGDPEERPTACCCFRNPELAPAHVQPSLRFLSLDLETTPDASGSSRRRWSATGSRRCTSSRPERLPGAHAHRDEAGLLRALVARIRRARPRRAARLERRRLRPARARRALRGARHRARRLGRAPARIGFQEDRGFTRQTRAHDPGPHGARRHRAGARRAEAARLPARDGRAGGARTRQAARSRRARRRARDPAPAPRGSRGARAPTTARTRASCSRSSSTRGCSTLCVERSLLSGMQLDRVGASIASFDLLYLPELRRRGYVAPSVDADARERRRAGGALLDPVPGFHRNVAVFDFKSLYPSLIRTFDLDPLAHALVALDADARPMRSSRRTARASRAAAGILPGVVDRFWEARAAARERGDRHAAQAIKIMLNALFGVLGATACRFFDAGRGERDHELRPADAALDARRLRRAGRARALRRHRFGVRPGDRARRGGAAARARRGAHRAIASRSEYRVESRLELEFDRYFDHFFLPRLRGGRGASHKRYAGWADGALVVAGLEAVRRDWPAIAARLQEGMLERIFTEQPVLPFVRERRRARCSPANATRSSCTRSACARRRSIATPRRHRRTYRPRASSRSRAFASGRWSATSSPRRGPSPCVPGRALPAAIDRRYYVDHVLRPDRRRDPDRARRELRRRARPRAAATARPALRSRLAGPSGSPKR